MDSKDNFIKELGKFISNLDTEYLIGVSNKGIVNRAVKDLEKLDSIQYEIQDSAIKFNFNDIECLITEDINRYKCNCPSRNICKHIVMCYLYLMNNKNNIFGDEAEEKSHAKENFDELRKFKIEDIRNIIGNRDFNNILNRIEFGVPVDIKEDSIVTVDFKDEGITVKMPPNIINSVCTCKSKELCIHKAEALILYKLNKGDITLEELREYKEESFNYNRIEIESAIKAIRDLIEGILVTGLSRTSKAILEKIDNVAILCHRYDLPNLEKNLRVIKEEFSLYIEKNASFSKGNLLDKITKLYISTVKLEKTKDIKKATEIIGEFKSSYYDIPPIELWGIATEEWKSKAGYEGLTCYFFNNERKEIMTYTISMPTYYDNNLSKKKTSNISSPWGLTCSVEDLCNINFKLIYGKINSENRISSSSKSQAIIIGTSTIDKLNISEFIYDDWTTLIDKLFLEENQFEKCIFLRPSTFSETEFDEIVQRVKVKIFDKFEKSLEMDIQFTNENKHFIRRIERVIKYKKASILFGRVYIEEGKVKFYPITAYNMDDGSKTNLTIF